MENKENNSIVQLAAKALPTFSGGSLTYNAEKNVYLTLGYTSPAGNTYFQAIRFSDKLIVYYDIGIGYARTFLNGIKLFCWDGQKPTLISQKFWGGSNWCDFTEYFAKEQSILMLKDFLEGQQKLLGNHASDQEIACFARSVVEEAQRKRLA